MRYFTSNTTQSRKLRQPWQWAMGLLATALLAACSPAAETAVPASAAAATASVPTAAVQLYGSDIRAEQIGGDFTLMDHHGKPVKLSDFKGKVVGLVFGYTHCPDVCPTNLLTFAEALKQLGPQAEAVQVLFISVDPERDTPALLAQYVPVFNPTFIGLTTDATNQGALSLVKQQYRIVSQKVPRGDDGHYLVDHSAGNYLIDKNGHAAVYEPHGQTAAQLAHDLKILLE